MAGRPAQREFETVVPCDETLWTSLTALANPVRLQIVLMLRDRERCVCHLTDALGLTQGTVSYHMGLLKKAGLVKDRRDPHDARWVYYRLNTDGVATFREALEGVLDTNRADATPADCCGPNSRTCTTGEEEA